MNYVRRRYGVLIGERTAEDIKIRIGHVFRHERPLYMRVCGRSLAEGLPREILLSSKEMIEALAGRLPPFRLGCRSGRANAARAGR